ncbi:hypothetical protein PIB30_005282 [Stylosanthes scabra]|uniref:Uncharacterized protein n=1 Tax=Stylosanthes scabra TaxID=79078 RepID=A0ABU6U2P0_9FABA|nr:hypothetical protein [Stylosanthes scabra]
MFNVIQNDSFAWCGRVGESVGSWARPVSFIGLRVEFGSVSAFWAVWAQRPEQLPRTYGASENPSFRKLIRCEFKSIDVRFSTDSMFVS